MPPIDDPVLGRLTWRADQAVLYGVLDDAVAGQITHAIFLRPAADSAAAAVARARRSLLRFRAREGEHRLATVGSGHDYLRRDKMAEVDVANSLVVSDFIFRADGSLLVYWGTPTVVTVIAADGEFVDVQTH